MDQKKYAFNNYGRKGEGHIDLEKAAKENNEKLIKGSEEFQAGKAAREFMDGISKASKEELEAMKENMQDKLGEFKSMAEALNYSYGNLLKEINSPNHDIAIIGKLSKDTESMGEDILNSINKYLGELPELKDNDLIAIRKEISHVYLDAGNTLERVKGDSFSVLGKRKTAAA